MSTSVNPSAAPSEAPTSAGPQRLTPAPAGGGAQRWVWLGVLLVVVLGAWYFLKPKPQQKPAATAVIRTAVARTGTLEQTIRIVGTTVAGKYANIAAPLLRGPDAGRALTLVSLAKPGSWVKKGEIVAQIDTTAAKDHIDDVNATVVASDADIRKRKAEQAITAENLRQAIRVAKSNLDKAKLDLGASEVRTPIDQEQLKLTVEENEAAYKDALQDYDITLASQKSELRILEITKERNVRHRDRHVADLVRFTIQTPMEGLVVMMSVFRGGDMGQIQVGDQMGPNQPFMKIVDPKSMQLEAGVNQVESEMIRVGQPVTVNFDAFPGVKLRGRIFAIGAIAVGGWRSSQYLRTIPVKVTLLEQDPRVIPDLTASADVLIGRRENKLLVPLEAVQNEGGKTVVYVKTATGFQPREVTLEDTNNTHAAIASGLKDGELVALSHPAPAPAK